MRVIAGKARHIQLKTIETMDTRPTTDRIKETLFNMLSNNIYEARFLDLFSGSGGIGIEALSRGASEAVMVENNPKAAMCISENLEKTKLKENGRVLVCDVLAAIDKLDGENKPFDYIFMDPPYNKGLEKEVLKYLADSSLLKEDTKIIVEASTETNFDYVEELGFEITKYKKYKTNVHVFLRRK